MDKMHRFFSAPQTTGAGTFGAILSGIGYILDRFWNFMGGDELHRVLGNAMLLVFLASAIIALGSAWYRIKTQRNKELKSEADRQISDMKRQLVESRLCNACLSGITPTECSVPIDHRSPFCKIELAKQKKIAKGRFLKWFAKNIFSEGSTK